MVGSTPSGPAANLKGARRENCGRVVRIAHHGDARNPRRHFLEDLQHFTDNRQFCYGKAGDVAAGVGQTFCVTPGNRIEAADSNDRDRARQSH